MSYVDVDSDKGRDHFARAEFRIEQRQIRAELAHLFHVHPIYTYMYTYTYVLRRY